MGDALLDSASSLIWFGDSKTNFEGGYGPVCKIRARRDALSYFSFASSLICVGDSKTNFEGDCGPVCKIHARRDAMSNFLGLATARQTFGTFCTAVLMSLIQGVRCRPVARFVDLLTDGMVVFV